MLFYASLSSFSDEGLDRLVAAELINYRESFAKPYLGSVASGCQSGLTGMNLKRNGWLPDRLFWTVHFLRLERKIQEVVSG
jgi:hypothetical protein